MGLVSSGSCKEEDRSGILCNPYFVNKEITATTTVVPTQIEKKQKRKINKLALLLKKEKLCNQALLSAQPNHLIAYSFLKNDSEVVTCESVIKQLKKRNKILEQRITSMKKLLKDQSCDPPIRIFDSKEISS